LEKNMVAFEGYSEPMAYDEHLADRVRDLLPPGDVVTERKMFGGLAFMLGGHMVVGVVKDTLMARLGPDLADRALDEPHVRPMDFTGRPMKGMVFIDSPGLAGEALARWVSAASEYARSLPPKPPKPIRSTR
jgi:TfoX/Sxy family transcriptional regulator of competence genes